MEYPPAVVACPKCRAVLADDPPRGADAEARGSRAPVPDVPPERCCAESSSTKAFPRCCAARPAGFWLGASRLVDVGVGRDPGAPRDSAEARALIADYLQALERGGEVRDEDVKGHRAGDGTVLDLDSVRESRPLCAWSPT